MSGYTHVVVATDFSVASRPAVTRAAQLAAVHGARVTLVHVIEYFPEDLPIKHIAPEDVDPAEYLERDARHRLQALAQEVAPGAALRVEFSTHSARRELPRIAREEGADLVVLGSHGRRGPAAHLGSTADAVAHSAHCDVLVVRTPT